MAPAAGAEKAPAKVNLTLRVLGRRAVRRDAVFINVIGGQFGDGSVSLFGTAQRRFRSRPRDVEARDVAHGVPDQGRHEGDAHND